MARPPIPPAPRKHAEKHSLPTGKAGGDHLFPPKAPSRDLFGSRSVKKPHPQSVSSRISQSGVRLGKPPVHKPPEPPLLPPALALPGSGKTPPLFIKIDKYREVVDNVHKLKTAAMSMRDALDALADIEKELTRGIQITHKALDHFNTTIATLDSKITRIPPQEVELPAGEFEEMDDYVKEVNEQMDRIRKELQSI